MATTAFNDLITFSRGSNATVTGPNGLIQWAPSNQLLNSQDLEATYWVKLNATITANTSVAPDSSITAETLTSTSSVSTTTGVYRGISFTSGHTASVYVKAGTSNIAWVSSNTGESYAVFNLATGAVIEAGNATASILAVGNGWYRIAAANTTVAGTFFIVGGKDAYTTGHPWANGTWTSGNTILVWGAQLELGSTATTYNNTSVRNLLGFSEAFDSGNWIKAACSIVTGAQANPINGLFNAQKLMEDTTNTQHFIYNASSVASGPVTLSVYAKFAGRRWLRLSASNGPNVWFDLVNGVLGTVTAGATASITPVGNGWYRCSSTVTYNNTINYIFLADANNSFTHAGDGNSGVYIYGAMLSNSASLDPYVPTPGAAPSSTAYYGPRFDYDPVTLLPRGLLVEEARTNLLLRSEEFDNASWSKQNATVVANAAVAPDGALTADKLVDNTANNDHYVTQSAVLSAGVFTFSAYLKQAELSAANLWFNATVQGVAYFNLANGTVAVTPGAILNSATITSVGNGWYRCTITTNSLGAATYFPVIGTGNPTPYVGAGNGIFLWGAQLEAGAFATSYIPTIASTVTRSADVATITGSLFSQWYSSAAGTFVADFQTIQSGVMAATSYVLAMDTSGSKRIIYVAQSADVATTFDGTTIIGAVGDVTGPPAKVASAYDASGRAIVANNGAVATGAVVSTYAASTSLNIGSLGGGQSLGWLRSIRYVPVRAADFQLQQVTT